MSFTRLLPRLKKRVFSDTAGADGGKTKKRPSPSQRNLQFDLFAQLSDMSAMVTAGVSRSALFDGAAQLPYASAKYFKDVNTLVRKMNTDYAEAFRIIAERTKQQEVRGLLLRMGGSLSSGEDETDFLRREAEVIGETFGNQYERDVEALKKWADAYVTLLVASGLIVIVAVISMMIYQVGVVLIVGLAMLMIFATCMGAWIIYASAPREIKTRISGPSSKKQLLAAKLFRITIPLALAVCSVALLLDKELGLVLILGTAIVFPAGLIINKDDGDITKKDGDIPTLVRVLGGTASALGTTVIEAVTKTDRRSMGSLMPEVTRLRYRFSAGIKPDLCWNALVDETGSEVIDRTIHMFWHSLSLGGDPAKVGAAAAFFSSRIAFLRATRGMVASTFRYLILPLHLAMVGLLEFILEIMALFSSTIGDSSETLSGFSGFPDSLSQGSLLTFGQIDMQMVNYLVTLVVLVLTVANAYAPKAADGGHNMKVAYNLSMMMFLTGGLMLLVPRGVDAIFSSIVSI